MNSQQVQNEMNEQIKHELYSAYLYLAMAAHFEAENLMGFAHWMKVQSKEEVEHAMKFYEFIHDRNGRVTLQAIDQPPTQFGSPESMFEQSLEHEQFITGRIDHIYAVAMQENDYAAISFLKWFVDEQVEEEKNAVQILDTLKMVGNNPAGLFMADRQLASRGR